MSHMTKLLFHMLLFAPLMFLATMLFTHSLIRLGGVSPGFRKSLAEVVVFMLLIFGYFGAAATFVIQNSELYKESTLGWFSVVAGFVIFMTPSALYIFKTKIEALNQAGYYVQKRDGST